MVCIDCGEDFNRPAHKPYLVRCFNCYGHWKRYCDAYDPTADYSGNYLQVEDFGLRDRVRQLLQLCHPDKHNNSKTATEVTQWLLSIPR